MTKLIKAAHEAKKDGYIYFSSVVKSHFNTVYHNIVKIDDIIQAGKWIPAEIINFESGARGRFGVRELPEKCINKSAAIEKYCK